MSAVLRLLACLRKKTCNLPLRIITPAVGTLDLRLCIKLLNGEKHGEILAAVLAHIFICRHDALLDLRNDGLYFYFTISQNARNHITIHFSSTLLTPDVRHEGDMTPAFFSCIIYEPQARVNSPYLSFMESMARRTDLRFLSSSMRGI